MFKVTFCGCACVGWNVGCNTQTHTYILYKQQRKTYKLNVCLYVPIIHFNCMYVHGSSFDFIFKKERVQDFSISVLKKINFVCLCVCASYCKVFGFVEHCIADLFNFYRIKLHTLGRRLINKHFSANF